MKNDVQIHRRRSIRLKDWDYSQSGAYFITIVTYRRECLFGKIEDGRMIPTPMGQIADDHWRAIPDHFPTIELGAYVVMPNHIHGIIMIQSHGVDIPIVGATHWVAPTGRPNGPKRGSIGGIVGAYKMSVTRRIQRELDGANIWQRNYYEHIIRDENEHSRIHLYIESNIDNWNLDDENPSNPK